METDPQMTTAHFTDSNGTRHHLAVGERLHAPANDLHATVTGFSNSSSGTLRVHTDVTDSGPHTEVAKTIGDRLADGDIVRE